jgi:hypothetical protein
VSGDSVLTAASTVTCTHAVPGTVTLAGTGKLRVNGSAALRAADVVGAAVACGAPADPNTGSKPCTTVIAVTGGTASKLAVGGLPVLCESLAGSTDGTKPLTPPSPAGLSAAAGQSKLTAS